VNARPGLSSLDHDLLAALVDAGVWGVDIGAVRQASTWTTAAEQDLRRRIDIALAMKGDPVFGDLERVQIDDDVLGYGTSAAAADAGAALADRIKDDIGNDGHMVPEDVLEELERHQHDPDFTAAFFNRLGAQRAAAFPRWLMGVQANTEGQLTVQGHLNQPEDVERWLRTYSTALSTASRAAGDTRLPDDFGERMALSDPWGTSQLLRLDDDDGHQLVFGRKFLVGAGEELIPYMQRLKENGSQREELAATVGIPGVTLLLGTSDGDRYQDFMVGYLEALAANTPAAQAIVLHKTASGGYDYLSFLAQGVDNGITDYGDNGNALGHVFEAAAIKVRDKSPAGRDSAEAAAAIVDILAKGHDGNAVFVPDDARDSVGRLLASYIGDVENAASGDAKNLGRSEVPATPNQADPAYRVSFNVDNLQAVAGQTMLDGRARAIVLTAASQESAALFAVEAHGKQGQGPQVLAPAMGRVYNLYGFLAAGVNRAGLDDATARDQARADFAQSLSDVVGLLPLPRTITEGAGEITSSTIELVRGRITDAATGAVRSDYASQAIEDARNNADTFGLTADVLALAVAQRYGLFPPGEDPVTWSRDHPGVISPDEAFTDADGVFSYERLMGSSGSQRGYNEYMREAQGGKDFQTMTSAEYSNYLKQLFMWDQ